MATQLMLLVLKIYRKEPLHFSSAPNNNYFILNGPKPLVIHDEACLFLGAKDTTQNPTTYLPNPCQLSDENNFKKYAEDKFFILHFD